MVYHICPSLKLLYLLSTDLQIPKKRYLITNESPHCVGQNILAPDWTNECRPRASCRPGYCPAPTASAPPSPGPTGCTSWTTPPRESWRCKLHADIYSTCSSLSSGKLVRFNSKGARILENLRRHSLQRKRNQLASVPHCSIKTLLDCAQISLLSFDNLYL